MITQDLCKSPFVVVQIFLLKFTTSIVVFDMLSFCWKLMRNLRQRVNNQKIVTVKHRSRRNRVAKRFGFGVRTIERMQLIRY